MSVLGYSCSRRSYTGLRARAMALALVSARYPQPSRMMRTSGLGLAIFHQIFRHGDTDTRRRHDNESIGLRRVFQTWRAGSSLPRQLLNYFTMLGVEAR